MNELCSKDGLSMNSSKTNVMIFRNGGRLRTNGKADINIEPLIETPYYKYLGIMFSSRLC